MPIYLDHHATTPVDPRVLEKMLPFFRETFGNAASINHVFGWRAAAAVQVARDQIAALLNVSAKSIVFTSGATEANNIALKGVLAAAGPNRHVLTTSVEHKAILDPLKRMERRGHSVTVIPVDDEGIVDPEQLEAAIRPETVLISVMWANNEIGSIQPIGEISEICRKRKVLLHTDAAQAAGKIPLDLIETPVDLLSLSGHKLYAPQGIGILYVRQRAPRIQIEPLFDGGGHEGHLRSGTLPVPLIVGLGVACQIAQDELTTESQRLSELSLRLRNGLNQRLAGLTFNGPVGATRLPGNVHVSVAGINGVALLANLREIAVSSGSACTTADPEPSHVLRAIGIPEALSLASIRFGLGRETTTDQIDFTISYFAEIVTRLRNQSRDLELHAPGPG
ncbi:MAG: iscS [Planctomycetaceae bacterium]|nr:iscS [Planctomycetaceae bacterium]